MYFVGGKKDDSPGVGFHGDEWKKPDLPDWQIGSTKKIEHSVEEIPTKDLKDKIPEKPLW